MKQLISDIKNHSFQKAYLLYGQEDYLIRFYANRIVDSTVLEEDRFMNLDIFTEEEATLDKLEASVSTYPLMGEKRVTWIKNSGWFSSKKLSPEEIERLLKILSDLMETSLVIFMESNVDKRIGLFKAFGKIGYAAELNTPDEADLIRFIARMLLPYQKQISSQTASYFIQNIGGDMIHMQLEIGKAAAHAADSPIVTVGDIDAVCTRQPETDVFKMTDALGNRNRTEAMKIYERLLSVNESPQRVFYLLVSQIRKIYRVRLAQEERLSKDDTAAFSGVSPRALWAWEKQSRAFRKEHLEALIVYMTELDEKMKTGQLDPADLVLSLISHC